MDIDVRIFRVAMDRRVGGWRWAKAGPSTPHDRSRRNDRAALRM